MKKFIFILCMIFIAITVTADFHDPNYWFDYDSDSEGDCSVSGMSTRYNLLEDPGFTRWWTYASASYNGNWIKGYILDLWISWKQKKTEHRFYGNGFDNLTFQRTYMTGQTNWASSSAHCDPAHAFTGVNEL